MTFFELEKRFFYRISVKLYLIATLLQLLDKKTKFCVDAESKHENQTYAAEQQRIFEILTSSQICSSSMEKAQIDPRPFAIGLGLKFGVAKSYL